MRGVTSPSATLYPSADRGRVTIRGDRQPYIHYLWGRCDIAHALDGWAVPHPNSKRDHSQVQSLQFTLMTTKTFFGSLCLLLLGTSACTKGGDTELTTKHHPIPARVQQMAQEQDPLALALAVGLAPKGSCDDLDTAPSGR